MGATRQEAALGLLRSVFVALLALLVGGLAAAAGGGVAGLFQFAEGDSEFVVVRTVAQFLGFILVGVAFFALVDWSVSVRVPTAREAAIVAGGVVGLLAAQYGMLLLLSEFGLSVGENQAITAGDGSPVYYLYMLPVSILFVGPAEELIFRGIVQGEVSRSLGPRVGIGVATVLFALIHYGVEGGLGEQLAYVGVVAVLSVGLGVIYEYTGNLAVPALVHGSYNAVLFALRYLGETGAI